MVAVLVVLALPWPYLDLALTSLWPYFVHALTLPSHYLDIALSLPCPCLDLGFPLPWHYLDLSFILLWLYLDFALTLPWPSLDLEFKAPEKLDPQNFVKIWSVTAEILLICTNDARTYVALTNVIGAVLKPTLKVGSKLGQWQLRYYRYGQM